MKNENRARSRIAWADPSAECDDDGDDGGRHIRFACR
jgi:hypothetical protein